MFALSVPVCEIFTVEMCMTMSLTFRMGHGRKCVCQAKGYMRLSTLAIAFFTLSLTVCELITYELANVLSIRIFDLERDGQRRSRIG